MLRTNEELIAMLREARASKSEFNRVALLRPLVGEIEAAQADGVSLKTIRETLAKGGIDMPLATLKTILYRHRKKHGRTNKAAPVEQGNTPIKTVPVLPSSVRPVPKDAKDRDDIPQTGMERLNAIMRSTPDLAELAQMMKDKRKEEARKEREQKELERRNQS